MNTARLKQLEMDLRAADPDVFNLSRWDTGPIGVFCRAHPAWSIKLSFGAVPYPEFEEWACNRAVEEYFGLTPRQQRHLFDAVEYPDWWEGTTGPREVANRIRGLLAGKNVEMDAEMEMEDVE